MSRPSPEVPNGDTPGRRWSLGPRADRLGLIDELCRTSFTRRSSDEGLAGAYRCSCRSGGPDAHAHEPYCDAGYLRITSSPEAAFECIVAVGENTTVRNDAFTMLYSLIQRQDRRRSARNMCRRIFVSLSKPLNASLRSHPGSGEMIRTCPLACEWCVRPGKIHGQ